VRPCLRGAVGVAALLGAWTASAADDPPLFVPPPPGSYALPAIDRVHEHMLLGPDGGKAPLLGLAPDQVALVSFVYRACGDACPLALATLQRLDRHLAATPTLARRVRLVTVSFDPSHDTPERMGELARGLGPHADWRFLTARDEASMAAVLADFGQDALRAGAPDAPAIRHVLKLFLVDARGDVRNVYSSGFLNDEILWNDVVTVLGVAR
jgi:cytochrome oxidase Cu insertion factor (SCO1/SenC/PrrC family)